MCGGGASIRRKIRVWLFLYHATIQSAYLNKEIQAAAQGESINTLRGDERIKSHFTPCHFYEVTQLVCSHPANESRFYASSPEMSYGLKIGRRKPSCKVDAVIGAESGTAREYTAVKPSIAWSEEENT